tara:strand:+ start:994 stop:1212 length:219 start_codon:yes stop_codon:yes gene_type:complete
MDKDKFNIGDLVTIIEISAFPSLRDNDIGKLGIIVATYFDWVVRADILYIEIEGKKKGFYLQEVELISKWDE